LEYYKENGEILGNHSVFWERNLQNLVKSYTGFELANRQKTLRSNISRDQKKMEKMSTASAKQKFEVTLNKYRLELELVNKRIDELKKQ